MKNTVKRVGFGLAAAAMFAGLTTAGAVEAKGSDATIARGTCATGTWKLKGKPDSGVIEVEFEVDTNRIGQMWNVVIKDNGVTVFSGQRATLAPSGSFSVNRRISDRAGSDRIVAIATRNSTTCQGVITI